MSDYAGMYNRLMAVLCGWSGLPSSEHIYDALSIIVAEKFPLENPGITVERLEKIGRAATEIEQVYSAMGGAEKIQLYMGMRKSKHAPPPLWADILRHDEEHVDRILSFSLAYPVNALTHNM